MGWGGNGMMTFLAHVHIFDATSECLSCYTEIMVGWGGDGMMTILAHVHIFDATSVCLSCYGDHGGVGREWDDDVPCTCTHL